MALKKSIKCDCCDKELIEDTMMPHKYILQLESIDVAINSTGATYSVFMKPPVGKKHFCDIDCLHDWIIIWGAK